MLTLTTAPFLASCRSSKSATTEQTAQTQENSEYQQRLDSMVRVEIGRRLTTLRQENSQSETDITIFDTSLPPDSLTGLPPVKAKVKHTKNVQRKDSTQKESQQRTEASVERQTAAKGSKTTDTHSKTKETAQPTHTILYSRLCGLLCVLLVAAAVVGIIKYKRKTSKQQWQQV